MNTLFHHRVSCSALLGGLLCVAPLSVAAAKAPDAEGASPAATVEPAPTVETLKRDLKAGIDTVQRSPEATDPLRAAIDAAAAAPGVLANDPDTHELRIEGLLALATAHLSRDETELAEAAIDEVIRISRGDAPDLDPLDAALVDLYATRVADPSLRPAGSIHVSCTPACRVILDGRVAGEGSDLVVTGIPLGEHVLRVESQAPSNPGFKQERFAITNEARNYDLSYVQPGSPQPPKRRPLVTARGQGPRDHADPDASGRRLPRWAGIVGMSTGVAAIAAGAVLIALDGRCPDGSDPRGDDPCLDVLNTQTAGIIAAAAGGATLAGFSVVLGLGEVKDARHRRSVSSASFTFRMRF